MWQETLKSDNATWRAVAEYAQERITELTGACCSLSSSDADIRASQAGIEELRRLLAAPQRLAAISQQMARPKQTNGY